MKKHVKYGILDDDGEVVRVVWDRPAATYSYVEIKYKPEPKPKQEYPTHLPQALM